MRPPRLHVRWMDLILEKSGHIVFKVFEGKLKFVFPLVSYVRIGTYIDVNLEKINKLHSLHSVRYEF
ncbi:MAG: hypothetical protein DRJ32_03860 [Thermoprotei archaeon]|nr:MAG: hypothetical protein DRJ32_03860 [Thermoprotei archaeon]